ncbi:MAG: 5'-methylthioadenosine phosphorylase [uncultured Thermomicrobiales bacterium]|uniref:S-methyl-5'-thioadenosine phosphorylase n=1 Tax=uncultured Thermomicrobiales bacterium TaxID=1645740 RepID=A0A6J4UJD8_9BACT|nr:MAG: 5'-methylthioadenosine phosphorylase [uncultured Thermomicrobiales bacterium]
MAVLGVIGGSGLYDLADLADRDERWVTTPFGAPSSPVVTGRIGNTRLAFLARHGRGHILNPSEVPYRANIFALRSLGVDRILSVSAVGSLREDLPPMTAVIPDQIIDQTRQRPRTFFEDGVVAHVGMADPFCGTLRATLHKRLTSVSEMAAMDGTYLCIEGPQFSTRAESNLYRSWGASIIGMTAMPEARLAREAGLCYAMMAMVTDYDVWHDTEDDVTVEAVMRVLQSNGVVAGDVIRLLATEDVQACESGCREALASAVVTADTGLSDAARSRLALFR